MPQHTEDEKRRFAAAVTAWLEGLPPEGRDWAEALLAAALDETGGDLGAALELARAEHAAAPEPPGDDQPG